MLLVAPDGHHELVREKLGKTNLRTDGSTANGYILAALHVAHGARHYLLGSVEAIVVFDGVVAHGSVKKFGLDPAGTNRHGAGFAFGVPAGALHQCLRRDEGVCAQLHARAER